jgi:hypothetical protein
MGLHILFLQQSITQKKKATAAYRIVKIPHCLEMRAVRLVQARLTLLRNKDEQRKRQLGLHQRLAQQQRALLRVLRLGRVGAYATRKGRDRIRPQQRSTGHGRDLCVRQGRQGLITGRLADELPQDNDLCWLAVLELVYDVLDDVERRARVAPEEQPEE